MSNRKYVLVMWNEEGDHGIRIYPHLECARSGQARARESGLDSVVYACEPDTCDGHGEVDPTAEPANENDKPS